jgi:hypothetical protein
MTLLLAMSYPGNWLGMLTATEGAALRHAMMTLLLAASGRKLLFLTALG